MLFFWTLLLLFTECGLQTLSLEKKVMKLAAIMISTVQLDSLYVCVSQSVMLAFCFSRLMPFSVTVNEVSATAFSERLQRRITSSAGWVHHSSCDRYGLSFLAWHLWFCCSCDTSWVSAPLLEGGNRCYFTSCNYMSKCKQPDYTLQSVLISLLFAKCTHSFCSVEHNA